MQQFIQLQPLTNIKCIKTGSLMCINRMIWIWTNSLCSHSAQAGWLLVHSVKPSCRLSPDADCNAASSLAGLGSSCYLCVKVFLISGSGEKKNNWKQLKERWTWRRAGSEKLSLWRQRSNENRYAHTPIQWHTNSTRDDQKHQTFLFLSGSRKWLPSTVIINKIKIK